MSGDHIGIVAVIADRFTPEPVCVVYHRVRNIFTVYVHCVNPQFIKALEKNGFGVSFGNDGRDLIYISRQ